MSSKDRTPPKLEELVGEFLTDRVFAAGEIGIVERTIRDCRLTTNQSVVRLFRGHELYRALEAIFSPHEIVAAIGVAIKQQRTDDDPADFIGGDPLFVANDGRLETPNEIFIASGITDKLLLTLLKRHKDKVLRVLGERLIDDLCAPCEIAEETNDPIASVNLLKRIADALKNTGLSVEKQVAILDPKVRKRYKIRFAETMREFEALLSGIATIAAEQGRKAAVNRTKAPDVSTSAKH